MHVLTENIAESPGFRLIIVYFALDRIFFFKFELKTLFLTSMKGKGVYNDRIDLTPASWWSVFGLEMVKK